MKKIKTKTLFILTLIMLTFINSNGQKIGTQLIVKATLTDHFCGEEGECTITFQAISGEYYSTGLTLDFGMISGFDDSTKTKWKIAYDEIAKKCNNDNHQETQCTCSLLNKKYLLCVTFKNVPIRDDLLNKTSKYYKRWIITSLERIP